MTHSGKHLADSCAHNAGIAVALQMERIGWLYAHYFALLLAMFASGKGFGGRGWGLLRTIVFGTSRLILPKNLVALRVRVQRLSVMLRRYLR